MDLPDDVILHIVSFLSAKKAACIKFLSRKWLNMFTVETDCVFDQSIDNVEASFEDFVDGLLAQHASHRIRRFFLRLTHVDDSQHNRVNDCLRNVLQLGVMDLQLDINEGQAYSLPAEIFCCRALVEMRLGSGFTIDVIPKIALLPCLKTIRLESVRFKSLDGCAFQRLLSVCPLLEELIIHGQNWEEWDWSHTVSSQTLKKLTIHRPSWEEYKYEDPKTISFDTPSLVYFEYYDALRHDYPVVNFESLVEARLCLPVFYVWYTYNLTNLIKGLKNVQILRLQVFGTMRPFWIFRESVPVFENMFHLSVDTVPFVCYHALQILLEKSPNLKTLTIEGPLHYNDCDSRRDWDEVCECLKGYSFLVPALLRSYR